MAKLLKLRRGTTTQHGSFTGAEGEVTVDTNKDTLVVHDGSTQSGFPLLRAEGGAQNISTSGTLASGNQTVTGNISVSGTVDGVDVAQLKTDFDAGADNINEGNSKVEVVDTGTGYVTTEVDGTEQIRTIPNQTTIKNLRVGENWTMADGTGNGIAINTSNNNDTITGTASNGLEIRSGSIELKQPGSPNNHYAVFNNNGCDLRVANVQKLVVNSDGTVDIKERLDAENGIAVSGNITCSGTVKGRDLSDDGQKLDGYTTSSIGELKNGVTGTTQAQSDNSTKVATTAYVRSAVAGVVDSAPAALDTLNELAAALGDDANYATTTATAIGEKLPKSGGQMTGNITFSGSQTVDGRDLSVDGNKLDNIEAGATADQTKSDIDNLGINADQVDGLEAASFLRADAADTAGSDITFNGGAGAVTIASGSDIRGSAGTWTGETAGKLQWHSNHMYFQTNSNWIFRSQNGTERAYIDSSGNYVGTGNVTAYSDARLKTDISTINDALGIVGKLRGVSYKWIKDNSDGIGVIAQEVEQVLPEVVLTNVSTDPATGETTEVKSVDYGKIVGVLINAVNELKAEVDELKVFLLGEEQGGK